MTNPNWHRFFDTEDGDDQCSRCAVVVTAEAHMTFTLPCPSGDCSSSKNPDRGCVFVPFKDGPCVCVYCGRPGGRDHAAEDDADEEFAAEQDAIAGALDILERVAAGDVLTFTLADSLADTTRL